MHRPPRFALLAILLVGCSSAAPQPLSVNPGMMAPMRPMPPPPPPAPTPPAYALASAVPDAPWRLPSRDGTPPPHPLAFAHWVGAGKTFALVRAHGGWFSIHESRGVEGPLIVPDQTVWVGVDGDDALYAATRDGALFRADSLASTTTAAGWKARVTIAKPTSWDATTGAIVAASAAGVHVSTDRGATFRTTKPSATFVPHTALVRPDGVIIVSTLEANVAPMISKDRGRTWQASTYPAANLTRAAGLISASSPCPAVLAKDGASWLAPGAPPPEMAGRGWEHAVDLSVVASGIGAAPRRTAIAPAAPDAKGGTTATTTCAPPPELARVRTGQSVEQGPRCQGIDCLRGATEPLPEPTRIEVDVLGDATCNAPPGERCDPKAARTSEPSIVFADLHARTIHVVAAPTGCHVDRVLSAGGLGLVACGDGASTKIFVGDATGSLQAEGAIAVSPAEIGSIAIAKDGTILLRARWDHDADRAAFVRAPAPAGTPSAWRAVSVGDAIELRVGPGGGALVLSPAATDALRISLDTPSGRSDLFARVPVPGHLVDVSLEGSKLLFWTLPQIHRGRVPPGTPAARGDAEQRWLSTAGTLEK